MSLLCAHGGLLLSSTSTSTELAVVGDASPYGYLYQIPSWDKTPIIGLDGRCRAVAKSPDGRFLAVATEYSPYLVLYDAMTWAKLPTPSNRPPGNAYAVAWTKDSSFLIVGGANSPYLRIYRVADWSALPSPATIPAGQVNGLSVSPDGSKLAVAVGTNSAATSIVVYDLSTWGTISVTAPRAYYGRSVAWSPDGSKLAIALNNSPYITIYETSGWTRLENPTSRMGNAHYSVEWSLDGRFLAFGAANVSPCFAVYNTGDLSRVAAPSQFPSGSIAAWALAFSPDSEILTIGINGTSGETLWAYDTQSWSKVQIYSQPTGPVYGLEFSQ